MCSLQSFMDENMPNWIRIHCSRYHSWAHRLTLSICYACLLISRELWHAVQNILNLEICGMKLLCALKTMKTVFSFLHEHDSDCSSPYYPQESKTTVLKWGTELLQKCSSLSCCRVAHWAAQVPNNSLRLSWYYMHEAFCSLERVCQLEISCTTQVIGAAHGWHRALHRLINTWYLKRLHEQIHSQAFSNCFKSMAEIWQSSRWELSDSFSMVHAQSTLSYQFCTAQPIQRCTLHHAHDFFRYDWHHQAYAETMGKDRKNVAIRHKLIVQLQADDWQLHMFVSIGFYSRPFSLIRHVSHW